MNNIQIGGRVSHYGWNEMCLCGRGWPRPPAWRGGGAVMDRWEQLTRNIWTKREGRAVCGREGRTPVSNASVSYKRELYWQCKGEQRRRISKEQQEGDKGGRVANKRKGERERRGVCKLWLVNGPCEMSVICSGAEIPVKFGCSGFTVPQGVWRRGGLVTRRIAIERTEPHDSSVIMGGKDSRDVSSTHAPGPQQRCAAD